MGVANWDRGHRGLPPDLTNKEYLFIFDYRSVSGF